jgi:hypothetical protein
MAMSQAKRMLRSGIAQVLLATGGPRRPAGGGRRAGNRHQQGKCTIRRPSVWIEHDGNGAGRDRYGHFHDHGRQPDDRGGRESVAPGHRALAGPARLHGCAAGELPAGAAEANGEGIIDLIETEPMAGTTMVPLNDDPRGYPSSAITPGHGPCQRHRLRRCSVFRRFHRLTAGVRSGDLPAADRVDDVRLGNHPPAPRVPPRTAG